MAETTTPRLMAAAKEFNIEQDLGASHALLESGVALVHVPCLGVADHLITTRAEIERYVGPRRLATCYFASVVTAGLTQIIVPPLLGSAPAPTIGASGGVFGLLLAYALMFPNRKVVPLIPPIPMPAWLFATLYAGVELFLGVTGSLSGVAHFAHLGGMIGSGLTVMQWRRARGVR